MDATGTHVVRLPESMADDMRTLQAAHTRAYRVPSGLLQRLARRQPAALTELRGRSVHHTRLRDQGHAYNLGSRSLMWVDQQLPDSAERAGSHVASAREIAALGRVASHIAKQFGQESQVRAKELGLS